MIAQNNIQANNQMANQRYNPMPFNPNTTPFQSSQQQQQQQSNSTTFNPFLPYTPFTGNSNPFVPKK